MSDSMPLVVAVVSVVAGLMVVRYLVTDSGPRGIRNNNPGNIKHNPANKWRGASVNQTDSTFVRFDSPVMGIRAMVKVLKTYYYQYGLTTVQQIIPRWAPSEDRNDVGAYISSVVSQSGIKADQQLKWPDDIERVVMAIIRHENGIQPYLAETIQAGVRAANEA